MRLTLAALVLAAGVLGVAAIAGPTLDGATITGSGSTNASGWDVALRSNGAGSATIRGQAARPFQASPELTARFFRDLAAARVANLPRVQLCMKSASFGVTVIARWHGWTTPDFGCPQRSPLGVDLARDVTAIQAAAKLSGGELRRRVYLAPSEPRRTEPTQTPRQGP